MKTIALPVGIDSFTKLREMGCYYVDKTEFITELLQQPFEVNLITRPRRFGKTLMMRMLSDFFDIRKDSKSMFEGLAIAQDTALCEKWMNQYPTLFLTLKSVEGLNFTGAFGMLESVIAEVCREHAYLAESEQIDAISKEIFLRLRASKGTEVELKDSLYTLMRMMQAYYGKPVILIIDEYDVPLAKASENGYYREMLDVLRAMLGKALKTNDSLKFAVITGCLRIAKESIFTGTNNFVSNTISDERFSNAFGFTEDEVAALLQEAGFPDRMADMKEWYDGYRFGSKDIFCPWDVLNYVGALLSNPKAIPANYWENTSHNGIIRKFIDRTDLAVNRKFETLLHGGSVTETITENLTYDMLHSSEENLWSVLYLTGYLTKADQDDEDHGALRPEQMRLKIPNKEIESIFEKTIAAWFKDSVSTDDRKQLFDTLWSGNAEKATELLSDLLFQTISYHDYKESYYHAFLTGLFAGVGYATESNYEYGEGRPDIIVRDDRHRKIMVIETKCADTKTAMETSCENAIRQIKRERYAEEFYEDYRTVLCYGVAFFKKNCLVKKL